MPNSKFIYGTAGWFYKDWVGPFYKEGTAESDFLPEYAKEFSAVEVDSTYYRIPPERMVQSWNRKTPDDFTFSPKMVGEVTHKKFLEGCDREVKQYLDAISHLEKKLGPIVLQFPYFKKAQGITLDVFLGKLLPFLDRLPDGPRFAVEVRNKPFLKPAFFKELKDRNVALVILDHVWMHPPDKILGLEGIFTSDYVPIRLLGDRYGIEKITKTWEKIVQDKSERLKGWAEVVRHALNSGLDVQAFANNHYAGHGPATIRELVELLQG